MFAQYLVGPMYVNEIRVSVRDVMVGNGEMQSLSGRTAAISRRGIGGVPSGERPENSDLGANCTAGSALTRGERRNSPKPTTRYLNRGELRGRERILIGADCSSCDSID